MRISDWSSDVCSSDLAGDLGGLAEADRQQAGRERIEAAGVPGLLGLEEVARTLQGLVRTQPRWLVQQQDAIELALGPARRAAHRGAGLAGKVRGRATAGRSARSEEHTSELPSLMRNSYAVFCLKKTN